MIFSAVRSRSRAGRGRAALFASLLLLACIALASPPAAGAAGAGGGRLALKKPVLGGSGTSGDRWACPRGACDAIVAAARKAKAADGGIVADGSGERKGLDPEDLQSAYKIPSAVESPQTIALVDAWGYPDAESDLATYRERYGLPACTRANGCFEKVNQSGKQGEYPEEEEGWDIEAALDEDMASAACPQCHILLVEGSGEYPAELGAAENTAAKLGATEISNSYGYPEALSEICGKTDCSQYEKDYEHPGVLITVASGDAGYADAYFELGFPTTDFPASSPNVIAVGGTALFKDPGSTRGWLEEVWNEPAIYAGTGSGCTTKAKPSWQTDKGCKKRTDNDLAAVAAVVSPVSIRVDGTWTLVGGTSVASPLMAGIAAHMSAYARSLGAHAFYEEPSALYDVTEGFNWNALDESGTSECAPQEYLCNAESGYDGPTGLGTPDGVPNLYEPPTVTSISPRKGPTAGGTAVKLTGTGLSTTTQVYFGSVPASEFKIGSSSSVTAVSPAAGKAGSVAVTVLTKGGKSSAGRLDKFDYQR